MGDPLSVAVDRLDITDVLTRYATALDTKRWALLASVFTSDAVCDYGSTGNPHGPEEIARTIRKTLESLDASQHLLGNVSVVVTGDEASATSYLLAQHVRIGARGGDTYLIGGVYDDHVLRTPDGWRIVRRALTRLWATGNPSVIARS